MKSYIALTVAAAVLSGCAAGGPGFGQDNRPFTNTESGILIGAASGAVLGAVAYKSNRSRGAVIGAIGGGIAGGAVGSYMDKQKQDLEKSLAQEIQAGHARIDKMPNDVVRITMTNQTAFETDSSTIKQGFNPTMDKVADVVLRYGKTTLTVVGHTDNVGSNDYNQKLSERRAHSVAEYLESKRVNGMRLALAGKGETQPIASNASETGRQANRRVEIYVEPVVEG
ncbi:MAG TPA: OmpA family protein [Burkholderiales bacterium]|jgi:outer membrane protein OmpA-like peptidoglycan-associated protein|nr:OmpA family protein [Burkholderiales bacterium]